MKNFPILEAAASHIEINGQMYELPVYLKHKEAPIYVKILSHRSSIFIIKKRQIDHLDFYRPYDGDFTDTTNQEFDRAFQDTFFHLAQLSEGNV